LVVTILLFLPKGQVLLKEFNNAFSISEVVLFKLIDLIKSILEGLISKFAGSLMVLHDFVVED